MSPSSTKLWLKVDFNSAQQKKSPRKHGAFNGFHAAIHFIKAGLDAGQGNGFVRIRWVGGLVGVGTSKYGDCIWKIEDVI